MISPTPGEAGKKLSPQQEREWRDAQAGARLGNPYATLCLHCYGRHQPPRNDECPRLALQKETPHD